MVYEISTFQSSLLSLAALKLYLEDALRPIKAITRVDAVDSLAVLILINVHSFNQEWKRFESFAKTDLDVRETLRIASPMVRRIRSWKGIGKLRSGALAHEPFNNDDQSLVDIAEFFGEGKAPSEVWEQILLGECAVYAIAIALTRHDKERELAVEVVYKNGPHDLPKCGISTKGEFEETMLKFRKDIVSGDANLSRMFE